MTGSDSSPPRPVSLPGAPAFRVVDDKPTFWDRAEAGLWEPETLQALATLLGPGDALLDIGAWVGPTALFGAALGAEAVAVEADPRALALLEANVAANPSLAARIRVLAGAASARPGTVRLAAPRKPGDSMTSVLVSSPHVFEVPALTPGQLVAALPRQRRSVVVKVDVEGAEYDLLPALAPALPGDVAALLVAFHPVLMQQAGRSAAETRAATRACFEALRAFEPESLEPAGRTASLEAATQGNPALLFRRRG